MKRLIGILAMLVLAGMLTACGQVGKPRTVKKIERDDDLLSHV